MPGPTGILHQLNPEQRALLLSWLDLYPTRQVLDRIAKPPPEGFAIQTHITSLRRFYQYALRDRKDELKEAALLPAPCEIGPTLQRATSALLLRRALSLAGSSEGDGHDFEKACKWLLAFQKQHLLQQQLDLEKQRLELEAKRAERSSPLGSLGQKHPVQVRPKRFLHPPSACMGKFSCPTQGALNPNEPQNLNQENTCPCTL